MNRALLIVAMLAGGCLRSTSYHCTDSAQCSGGVCQPEGFCSFSDTDCSSGQRFADSAGSFAGECVGGGGGDGGVDAADDATVDAPIDAAPVGCPASYMTVTNGQGNHVYRVLTQNMTFDQQKAACAADGANAYLAIPDDATELMAITGMFNFSQTFWVGIEDMTTEGTYVNTKGQPQTFLPWAPQQPNNTNNQDCVEVNRLERTFNDAMCGDTQRAACECEP